MVRTNGRTVTLCLGLTLVVFAAYANHFQNEFHFDDFTTITTNAYIGSLRNIPRFFLDASLGSSLPTNANYRPLTSATLAVDYWLGNGTNPFYFHLSTFAWFSVQLLLMFFLFRRLMELAAPHPSNIWTAWFATACYGLHPANAETVNYIIQRADLYCTLGIVASLLWFVAAPGERRRGWYLLPAVVACLSKAPALVFPLILLAYVLLFEREAVRATLPAFGVAAILAILSGRMTPATTLNVPIASPALYRLTQPWVALHYFKSFFLPTELSADSDWGYVSGPFSGEALAGYLFVAGLAALAVWSARKRETKPIAFGILWFFLALLPTSVMPLADVTNDHRMFFPFVGLVLAVFWGLRLALFRQPAPKLVRGAVAGLVVVLAAEAAGTHERNEVWRTEATLWRDVTEKSPQNARGLLNYGLTFENSGDYATALSYIQRAQALAPGTSTIELGSSIELNLGVLYGKMGRDQEAEQHFTRALSLAPDVSGPAFYYGQWLKYKGRVAEAQTQLETAVRVNPLGFPARYMLMDIYAQQQNRQALDALVQDTLRRQSNNDAARRFVEERAKLGALEPATPAAAPPLNPAPTPEAILNLSARSCNEGKYHECLDQAKKALELRPGYAEAYNNMAAAYSSMERWDQAIQAAAEAIRLKPDYPMARKNLDWAIEHKQQAHNGK